MTPPGLQVILEQLVDGHGLKAVLEALAETCQLKAAHVAEAWQDPTLTRRWEQAGKAVDTCSARTPIVDLAHLEGRP
jgi:hypothetical protein